MDQSEKLPEEIWAAFPPLLNPAPSIKNLDKILGKTGSFSPIASKSSWLKFFSKFLSLRFSCMKAWTDLGENGANSKLNRGNANWIIKLHFENLGKNEQHFVHFKQTIIRKSNRVKKCWEWMGSISPNPKSQNQIAWNSWNRGKCCPFFPRFCSCYFIFWFWVWNKGKCCPFCSNNLFILFDFLILSLKQGKMLPIFSQDFFQAIRFFQIWVWNRGKCFPFFPKKFFMLFDFSKFEVETRENAAHFFPRILSCYSIFQVWVWNRGKCCPFSQEFFHAIRFSKFEFETGENAALFPRNLFMPFDFPKLSFKQAKMLPIFPKNFLIWQMLPIYLQDFFMLFDFPKLSLKFHRGKCCLFFPRNSKSEIE